MAFLVKNVNVGRTSGPTAGAGQSVLDQWIHVQRDAKNLPQSTSEIIFRVYGGRILVKLLLGEVTTVIQSTDPVLDVQCSRLDSASALVGTADIIASTLDLSSDEVGTIYVVEGDTSAVVSTQLAAQQSANIKDWIMPQGQIYIETTASKTGAIKWDIWYQPLDEGAYVTAVDTATAKIT